MTFSLAWKPDGVIADCRGFALLRRRNGVEETVSTWVGFEDDDAKVGERRSSTNWPIQKYQWTGLHGQSGRHAAVSHRAHGRARQEQPQGRWRPCQRLDTQDRGDPQVRAQHRGLLQSRHRCGAMGLAAARRHRSRPQDGDTAQGHLDHRRSVPCLSDEGRSARGCSSSWPTRPRTRARSSPHSTSSTTSSSSGPAQARQARPCRAGQRQREEEGRGPERAGPQRPQGQGRPARPHDFAAGAQPQQNSW